MRVGEGTPSTGAWLVFNDTKLARRLEADGSGLHAREQRRFACDFLAEVNYLNAPSLCRIEDVSLDREPTHPGADDPEERDDRNRQGIAYSHRVVVVAVVPPLQRDHAIRRRPRTRESDSVAACRRS